MAQRLLSESYPFNHRSRRTPQIVKQRQFRIVITDHPRRSDRFNIETKQIRGGGNYRQTKPTKGSLRIGNKTPQLTKERTNPRGGTKNITTKAHQFVCFSEHIDKFLSDSSDHELRCPCCGTISTSMGSFDSANPMNGRMCPVCKTLERHRKACIMLGTGVKRNEINFDKACASTSDKCKKQELLTRTDPAENAQIPFRLLSFGPHPQMEKVLNQAPNVDHIGLDFFAEGYSYSPLTFHADVTDLKLPPKFADGIIILHVLEHITELDTALSELHRVLKPTGWMMFEVPSYVDQSKPTSDCRGKTKEEKLKGCGQVDHVWKLNDPAMDASLVKAGFKCYDVNRSDYGIAEPILDGMKVVTPWEVTHGVLKMCKP